ncbi:hypothetical protein AK812_SmicGene22177 [Symbiodinium microadriaticum]|uniref:Uncharacterized protein n=1 Tax=Symbiodinium microadriaticum TaxID=2951 RepID=A0A1Q9DKG6_SYMMI|nr:hypothetical protein AK812_SmicGene22177 [Symbiodinium microadriaticum]
MLPETKFYPGAREEPSAGWVGNTSKREAIADAVLGQNSNPGALLDLQVLWPLSALSRMEEEDDDCNEEEGAQGEASVRHEEAPVGTQCWTCQRGICSGKFLGNANETCWQGRDRPRKYSEAGIFYAALKERPAKEPWLKTGRPAFKAAGVHLKLHTAEPMGPPASIVHQVATTLQRRHARRQLILQLQHPTLQAATRFFRRRALGASSIDRAPSSDNVATKTCKDSARYPPADDGQCAAATLELRRSANRGAHRAFAFTFQAQREMLVQTRPRWVHHRLDAEGYTRDLQQSCTKQRQRCFEDAQGDTVPNIAVSTFLHLKVLEERATMAWCTSVAREALASAESVADSKIDKFESWPELFSDARRRRTSA